MAHLSFWFFLIFSDLVFGQVSTTALDLDQASINTTYHRYRQDTSLQLPVDQERFANFCPVDSFRLDLMLEDSVIVVDRHNKLFSVYEQGFLVHWGFIARARRLDGTPAGSFRIQHKWRRIYSKKYGNVPMPYALHIVGHICFHVGEIGEGAASHGCIRLNEADAKWLYSWARVRTKVIID
jgi:hypothetical protein